MKYFLVEGIVENPQYMNDDLMKKHQNYIGQLMDEGKVLFSSLKEDMSSSITFIKEESRHRVESFYAKEPFFQSQIVRYKITELQLHYHYDRIHDWFL